MHLPPGSMSRQHWDRERQRAPCRELREAFLPLVADREHLALEHLELVRLVAEPARLVARRREHLAVPERPQRVVDQRAAAEAGPAVAAAVEQMQ